MSDFAFCRNVDLTLLDECPTVLSWFDVIHSTSRFKCVSHTIEPDCRILPFPFTETLMRHICRNETKYAAFIAKTILAKNLF